MNILLVHVLGKTEVGIVQKFICDRPAAAERWPLLNFIVYVSINVVYNVCIFLFATGRKYYSETFPSIYLAIFNIIT